MKTSLAPAFHLEAACSRSSLLSLPVERSGVAIAINSASGGDHPTFACGRISLSSGSDFGAVAECSAMLFPTFPFGSAGSESLLIWFIESAASLSSQSLWYSPFFQTINEDRFSSPVAPTPAKHHTSKADDIGVNFIS
ncbi:MAG: hypothetical protein P1U90_11215 [Akkermansiaceae bacterium]|nr:hypothetical protein [Akkermansiaceae bacterium]